MKQIIIKDADFSANAIKVQLYVESTLLSVASESAGSRNTTATAVRQGKRLSGWANSTCKPILLKAGESVTLSGLQGKVSGTEALKVDFCYYTSDVAVPVSTSPNANIAGTLSNYNVNNYYPLNKEGNSDSVEITNRFGQDYYFAFSFCGVGGNQILPLNYNLELKW